MKINKAYIVYNWAIARLSNGPCIVGNSRCL